MTAILTAGLPAETVGWLARRLPGAAVEAAADGRALLRALSSRSWAVVVLDTLPDLPPVDALRALRSLPEGRSVPVVFCSRGRVDAATGQLLVGKLGVTHLLLHPVDRDELLRHVATLAATPVAEDVPEAARAGLSGAVGELWERFRGSVLERVSAVEECALAVLEGNLDEELRRRGEREAHKLTGAVGTFGFTEGSRLAREAEGLLEGTAPLGAPQALRLSELAVALRAELERPAPPQEAPAARVSDDRPLLLVVDDDRELAERLTIEAAGRQFRTEVAARVTDARRALIRHRPDVVLLDLSFDEEVETGLDLLSELSDRVPPIPVVVLTARGGFSDRVEAARRGARGFLQKPTPPAQVVDAAQQVLQRSAPADTRVLAVDDDPHVLQALRALLEPRGVHVATLDDPLRFWDVLEEAAPDLLVLDVDMPHLNGIELCRVVRNDARWSGTPVLFLTARSDPHSIHRVFAAGADDYVAKPFVGPELVTRIVNRLDRVHLHRTRAETDPLTGVANRRKSEEVVVHFLHLAARQKQPFSLAVLDLDLFKSVNDRHGHAAGDEVLQRVARVLVRSFRAEDVVARWGGEEFVVGMFGAAKGDGVQRLDQVLARVREERFGEPGAEFSGVSFSAGIAEFPRDGEDLPALYRAADEAMYRAKEEGRGRVVATGWSPEQARDVRTVDVLLVDDDPALAGLLLHALETRGYRTHWLQDGQVAVDSLSGESPALRARVVLLDVDLPGLDGLGVLRALRGEQGVQRTRVIVLTARAGEAETVQALELGAADHVAKPFSVPVLLQRIRRAMDGERGR